MTSRWLALALLASVALSGCNRHADEVTPEVVRRDAFTRALIEDAGAERAFGVSSTTDILFEEGFSPVGFDPPGRFKGHAHRWMGQNAHVRLRVRSGRPMKLVVAGWIDQNVIKTRPVLEFMIDGQLAYASPPIENEHYWTETVIGPELQRRTWIDLNVHVSGVGIHWHDPPELRALVVHRFDWVEAQPAL